MPKQEDPSAFERAARNFVTASKVQLAAALILNSTSAMNAANALGRQHGEEPRFTTDSFWSDVESVYDQLGLPHQDGIILPGKLFED